eukprot:1861339-Amphidinium_carterae.1
MPSASHHHGLAVPLRSNCRNTQSRDDYKLVRFSSRAFLMLNGLQRSKRFCGSQEWLFRRVWHACVEACLAQAPCPDTLWVAEGAQWLAGGKTN